MIGIDALQAHLARGGFRIPLEELEKRSVEDLAAAEEWVTSLLNLAKGNLAPYAGKRMMRPEWLAAYVTSTTT